MGDRPDQRGREQRPALLVGTVGGVHFKLTDMDLTPPDVDPIYASSADTEGDPFVGFRYA